MLLDNLLHSRPCHLGTLNGHSPQTLSAQQTKQCQQPHFFPSQTAQVKVHGNSNLADHLGSDLRSFKTSTATSCQCSLNWHVVFQSEAPSQSWIEHITGKHTMKPCMDLGNIWKKCDFLIQEALGQIPVQLCHCETHCLKFGGSFRSQSQSFCIFLRIFSVSMFILSQVLIFLCTGLAASMFSTQRWNIGTAKEATWAALPFSFGPPFFLSKMDTFDMPRYLSEIFSSL